MVDLSLPNSAISSQLGLGLSAPAYAGSSGFALPQPSFNMNGMSVPAPNVSGASFDWSSIFGALTSLEGGLSAGDLTVNPDGTMSYKSNGWEEFFHGDRKNQNVAAVASYNQALKQYNEQFALQKDSYEFNKDLSTRQQNLAEESYYKGTLQQAAQLQQLGINPAAFGSQVSGQSMSGGSSIQSGSASSGNISAPNMSNGAGMDLSAISVLAGLKAKNEELAIAKYNAQTSRISANASAENSLASADNVRAMTNFLEANGYTASPYSSTPDGIRTSKVFDIGNVITSALIGYFSGKKGGKKPPKGGSSGSGSFVPPPLPAPSGNTSSVPNPYYKDNGLYQEMDNSTYALPESFGIGDIGRVLTEASQYRKQKKYSQFWRDVSGVLKDANLPEISLGVTYVLRMIPMLIGAPIL